MSIRYVHNMALVNELAMLIKNNPDMRFGQILRNYGFISEIPEGTVSSLGYMFWENEFNLEPDKLLVRVKQRKVELG